MPAHAAGPVSEKHPASRQYAAATGPPRTGCGALARLLLVAAALAAAAVGAGAIAFLANQRARISQLEASIAQLQASRHAASALAAGVPQQTRSLQEDAVLAGTAAVDWRVAVNDSGIAFRDGNATLVLHEANGLGIRATEDGAGVHVDGELRSATISRAAEAIAALNATAHQLHNNLSALIAECPTACV